MIELKVTYSHKISLSLSLSLFFISSKASNNNKLFFLPPTPEQHCWLPLASIKGHKGVNSFFKKTPRVYLDVWMDSNTGQVASAAQVESISATNTTSASTLVAGTLTLALRGPSNSYDTFDKNFKLALSRKEWQVRKSDSTPCLHTFMLMLIFPIFLFLFRTENSGEEFDCRREVRKE